MRGSRRLDGIDGRWRFSQASDSITRAAAVKIAAVAQLEGLRGYFPSRHHVARLILLTLLRLNNPRKLDCFFRYAPARGCDTHRTRAAESLWPNHAPTCVDLVFRRYNKRHNLHRSSGHNVGYSTRERAASFTSITLAPMAALCFARHADRT